MAQGYKTGGRKSGTPNRATRARTEAAALSGLMPLDHMLAVMRNRRADASRRDEMAKAAAPYLHPRFAAVQPKPADSLFEQADLAILTVDELETLNRLFTKILEPVRT